MLCWGTRFIKSSFCLKLLNHLSSSHSWGETSVKSSEHLLPRSPFSPLNAVCTKYNLLRVRAVQYPRHETGSPPWTFTSPRKLGQPVWQVTVSKKNKPHLQCDRRQLTGFVMLFLIRGPRARSYEMMTRHKERREDGVRRHKQDDIVQEQQTVWLLPIICRGSVPKDRRSSAWS